MDASRRKRFLFSCWHTTNPTELQLIIFFYLALQDRLVVFTACCSAPQNSRLREELRLLCRWYKAGIGGWPSSANALTFSNRPLAIAAIAAVSKCDSSSVHCYTWSEHERAEREQTGVFLLRRQRYTGALFDSSIKTFARSRLGNNDAKTDLAPATKTRRVLWGLYRITQHVVRTSKLTSAPEGLLTGRHSPTQGELLYQMRWNDVREADKLFDKQKNVGSRVDNRDSNRKGKWHMYVFN